MATRDAVLAQFNFRTRKNIMPASAVPVRGGNVNLVASNPNRLAFYFVNTSPMPLKLSNSGSAGALGWPIGPNGGDMLFHYLEDFETVTEPFTVMWNTTEPVDFFWWEIETY